MNDAAVPTLAEVAAAFFARNAARKAARAATLAADGSPAANRAWAEAKRADARFESVRRARVAFLAE